MDLKGVGVTNFSSVYGYVQKASAISQNYYPERLGRLYLINAPWGFSSVFSVIKKFLDPVTVAKIHVLGSGYKSELLAQIPRESLPKEFGGACACPGGCALSDDGPWQDSKWAKPAAWEKNKAGGAGHEINNVDTMVGEGMPSGSGAGSGSSHQIPGGAAAHHH